MISHQSNPKIVVLPGVGEISMFRKKGVRNLRLKVHPEKGILMTVPYGIPYSHALEFAKSKTNWIHKALEKLDIRKQENTLYGLGEFKATRFHSLIVQQHSKASLRCNISRGTIAVWFPEEASIEDPKVQDYIRHCLEETWRIEAKHHLPDRVSKFAQEFELPYNKLSFRNNKSRWGSCSGKNNISLNIHLMRLPDELIDYVILHELAHTKIKNHSPAFWDYLSEILPNAQVLDKELNRYSLSYW